MLLLDVGNTLTKWRFEGPVCPYPVGRFLNDGLLTEVEKLLEDYLPTEVYISWVGEASKKEPLITLLKSKRVACHMLESPQQMSGLTNGYTSPSSLGVDRWLAMLGVWVKWKRSFCVVDAGTALTLDFVSEDGVHLGGYILPGLRTLVGALVRSTALISASSDTPELVCTSPGKNTNEAVYRGALIALVGGVERAKKEVLRNSNDQHLLCVIGGGDSGVLFDHLEGVWQLNEQLVLDGISAHIVTTKRNTDRL